RKRMSASVASGEVLAARSAARPSASPAIRSRIVGYSLPIRAPRSTTPSPDTAPYEALPFDRKLRSFMRLYFLAGLDDPDADRAERDGDRAEESPEPGETQRVGVLHGVDQFAERAEALDRDPEADRGKDRGDDDADLGGNPHAGLPIAASQCWPVGTGSTHT